MTQDAPSATATHSSIATAVPTTSPDGSGDGSTSGWRASATTTNMLATAHQSAAKAARASAPIHPTTAAHSSAARWSGDAEVPARVLMRTGWAPAVGAHLSIAT